MKELIKTISKYMFISEEKVSNVHPMKKGMTNDSFLFDYNNKKYIIRIPGAGTEALINRKNEYDNYQVLKKYSFTDKVIYIDKENGYKISEFVEDSHNCNPLDDYELELCIKELKKFHNLNLTIDHEFNIFEKIEYYESLLNGKKSKYSDYDSTKNNIYKLKQYIDKLNKKYIMCHIDSVCDNFLIYDKNKVLMIDWEYGGMSDPDIDIAMFIVYSNLSKEMADKIINIYYSNKCDLKTRLKIYCYIACSGLLWSNWCEYKNMQGICFGEYEQNQYNFAKDYYKIFNKMREELNETF